MGVLRCFDGQSGGHNPLFGRCLEAGGNQSIRSPGGSSRFVEKVSSINLPEYRRAAKSGAVLKFGKGGHIKFDKFDVSGCALAFAARGRGTKA
jgi:hypothetical protein